MSRLHSDPLIQSEQDQFDQRLLTPTPERIKAFVAAVEAHAAA